MDYLLQSRRTSEKRRPWFRGVRSPEPEDFSPVRLSRRYFERFVSAFDDSHFRNSQAQIHEIRVIQLEIHFRYSGTTIIHKQFPEICSIHC